MNHPILSLQGITKVFRSKERTFTALKNVSLSVEKGKYLAITGKSGSGKSTLLNTITGIDHPTNVMVQANSIKMNE